jgi:hypothetical protein
MIVKPCLHIKTKITTVREQLLSISKNANIHIMSHRPRSGEDSGVENVWYEHCIIKLKENLSSWEVKTYELEIILQN